MSCHDDISFFFYCIVCPALCRYSISSAQVVSFSSFCLLFSWAYIICWACPILHHHGTCPYPSVTIVSFFFVLDNYHTMWQGVITTASLTIFVSGFPGWCSFPYLCSFHCQSIWCGLYFTGLASSLRWILISPSSPTIPFISEKFLGNKSWYSRSNSTIFSMVSSS
jgi:hypothetical protein